jgi:hypothetical protein
MFRRSARAILVTLSIAGAGASSGCRDECLRARIEAQAVLDGMEPASLPGLRQGAHALLQAEQTCRAAGRPLETTQLQRARARVLWHAARQQRAAEAKSGDP